mmetsp:Transcript_95043/g.220612  ORF Transcript_95043/g.220612 Transcript_95043/m.220612 type:complete len:710 (-) Transcript_95043:67-2196(-)
MQLSMVRCTMAAFLLVGAAAARSSRAETNPLAKVLELMDTLTAKITKEGEAEAKAYKEFFDWCDDTASSKKFEIKTATAKKEKLEALISEKAADISASDSKIKELVASIATAETDLKNAATVRAAEAADFKASEAELMDIIDTISRALAVIQREMAKNPAAFAQIDTSNIKGLLNSLSSVVDAAGFPSADKQKLLALVQSRQSSDADDEELGAPAAAVYKTHSEGIVDVLEDLKEKAEEQLASLRKAETNALHNFAMLKQSLTDQAAADTKDLEDEKASKAASAETKATAEGDLNGTEKDLADGKAALEMASTNCMQAAADHEATVKARDEELKVIAEARKVLEESTGGASEQAYSMIQTQRIGMRLQTRADLANAEVVNMVRKLAREHHSSALAQLASRIAAVMKFGSASGQDPFAKVKGLISDLITKLEAEAGAEATEKAYCDDEMAKTEEKKGELEDDISKLSAKMDQSSAKSAELKGDVKELQAELAALAQQQAEMDKIRQDEHAAYVEAKADLQAGLEGVRQALRILRDYYGGAALLQDGVAAAARQPAVPELHSKATGAGQSIIGILEVVESDFAKSLAAEETQEDSAQGEYEKTTQANTVTKTLKDQDVKYKTQEYESLDKSLSEMSGDRETADTQLSAVLEYYAKLKERCIAKPETYEQRQKRRAAEIQGLKEALSILEDETAFVQRGQRGLRGQQSLSTE